MRLNAPWLVNVLDCLSLLGCSFVTLWELSLGLDPEFFAFVVQAMQLAFSHKVTFYEFSKEPSTIGSGIEKLELNLIFF